MDQAGDFDHNLIVKPREVAYFALLHAFQGKNFISPYLENWRKGFNPSERDFRLAQEMALGTCRMALALDSIGQQLTSKNKLSLKLKERVLLRLALYQFCMMDRIPLHAIANETVTIAKKHGMRQKAQFFNALLRKLEKVQPILPTDHTPQGLSTRFSQPLIFVKTLLSTYGEKTTIDILTASNRPPILMARQRKKPFKFVLLSHPNTDETLYIQNIAPARLCTQLAEQMTHAPKRILDLCASPGGKLLMAHDLFGQAELYANDVSEDKVKKLRENLIKYHVQAHLTVGPGEKYVASQKFDLIILDVPCSNTGVLNKRPEARWRLAQEYLNPLKTIQLNLLKHALTLVSERGYIWYMTCSILPEENQLMIDYASKKFGIKKIYDYLQLPTEHGYDGGYGALLQPNSC